jgi:hypothetical protein
MVGRHFRGLIAGSILSDRVMRPMWPSVCGSGKRMTAFFDGTIFGAAAFRDSHCLKTEPVILQRSELGGVCLAGTRLRHAPPLFLNTVGADQALPLPQHPAPAPFSVCGMPV